MATVGVALRAVGQGEPGVSAARDAPAARSLCRVGGTVAMAALGSAVEALRGGSAKKPEATATLASKTVTLSVPPVAPHEVREATLVRPAPESKSVVRPLRSSDSPLMRARGLEPAGGVPTKKRRKKRRKHNKKANEASAEQGRDIVHGPGVGGGKILPKKAAVGAKKTTTTTDKPKSALDLWSKARQVKSTAIVATELTERTQRRIIPNKHAHTSRWDVDEVYREVFLMRPHLAQGADGTNNRNDGKGDMAKEDNWRERCADNPYLIGKLSAIDGVTRKLRAQFSRLGSLLGKSDWASVFAHYDTDNSGGLDRDEFIRAVRVDAKVPDSKLSDRDLDEVFKCIDTGLSLSLSLSLSLARAR